jgi:hypothetical protein
MNFIWNWGHVFWLLIRKPRRPCSHCYLLKAGFSKSLYLLIFCIGSHAAAGEHLRCVWNFKSAKALFGLTKHLLLSSRNVEYPLHLASWPSINWLLEGWNLRIVWGLVTLCRATHITWVSCTWLPDHTMQSEFYLSIASGQSVHEWVTTLW